MLFVSLVRDSDGKMIKHKVLEGNVCFYSFRALLIYSRQNKYYMIILTILIISVYSSKLIRPKVHWYNS